MQEKLVPLLKGIKTKEPAVMVTAFVFPLSNTSIQSYSVLFHSSLPWQFMTKWANTLIKKSLPLKYYHSYGGWALALYWHLNRYTAKQWESDCRILWWTDALSSSSKNSWKRFGSWRIEWKKHIQGTYARLNRLKTRPGELHLSKSLWFLALQLQRTVVLTSKAWSMERVRILSSSKALVQISLARWIVVCLPRLRCSLHQHHLPAHWAIPLNLSTKLSQLKPLCTAPAPILPTILHTSNHSWRTRHFRQ